MLSIPGYCWLCKMPLARPDWGFCSCCCAALPSLPLCCPCCGLPAGNSHTPCGRCLQHPPPWQQICFVTDYSPPLNQLIHRLKFHREPALARGLARLLLLQITAQKRTHGLQIPDTIVSTPLHTWRQWRRGFNQSDLLAAPLAKWLGCGYTSGALTRKMQGKIQHRLSARLRRHNLDNAFLLEIPVKGLHIAIVDDVVTTGSTVGEIARLLERNGAASIQIWCLCRTL